MTADLPTSVQSPSMLDQLDLWCLEHNATRRAERVLGGWEICIYAQWVGANGPEPRLVSGAWSKDYEVALLKLLNRLTQWTEAGGWNHG